MDPFDLFNKSLATFNSHTPLPTPLPTVGNCPDCGLADMEQVDWFNICAECGLQTKAIAAWTNVIGTSDYERFNIANACDRNSYSKKKRFDSIIDNLIGSQVQNFKSRDFANILGMDFRDSKTLRVELKKYKMTKYGPSINFFLRMKNYPVPEISREDIELCRDIFSEFLKIYESEDRGRKNFININLTLYHILQKIGIEVLPHQMSCMKIIKPASPLSAFITGILETIE